MLKCFLGNKSMWHPNNKEKASNGYSNLLSELPNLIWLANFWIGARLHLQKGAKVAAVSSFLLLNPSDSCLIGIFCLLLAFVFVPFTRRPGFILRTTSHNSINPGSRTSAEAEASEWIWIVCSAENINMTPPKCSHFTFCLVTIWCQTSKSLKRLNLVAELPPNNKWGGGSTV